MHTHLSLWLVLCASAVLVLVDGRNMYSPSFGGVFRDLQDIARENIHRIEVSANDLFGSAPPQIPRSISFKGMWQSGAESK
jgi:hypothetical protein